LATDIPFETYFVMIICLGYDYFMQKLKDGSAPKAAGAGGKK
jgi:hypothetical protein